ncbi:hypothetical protein Harman_33490 [Haloarcula mannanilytica]|uniref:Uncharacterized protein n=1 Tax=Haloarcula mannanilytica TaxID=2509225 RepID=A0A4C2ELI9_9EURY|nr:hypothetical protein [Haloarcula mannanilytica]GCF15414.1 hypothetical protein Harman_33490 [Haloarcula mannanilytica]
MDNRIRTGGLAVLVTVWVVVTAGAGAGVTYGLLSDEATASGTIQIEVGSATPPDGEAYNDANGNGRYDEGETTYSADELADFNDPSANLVIPESVESIEEQNDDIQIRASSISYNGTVESQNGDVSLTAVNGDIIVDGAALDSQNGQVVLDAQSGGISLTDGTITAQNNDFSLSAQESVNLTGTTVDLQNGNVQVTTSGYLSIDGAQISAANNHISLRAREISAKDAYVSSSNNYVRLSATRNGGGYLDVTSSTLSSQNNDITLESNGDIRANDSSIETKNGAVTADLGITEATLYLDGATIEDGDDAIAYQPNGIRVVPSDGPATGS